MKNLKKWNYMRKKQRPYQRKRKRKKCRLESEMLIERTFNRRLCRSRATRSRTDHPCKEMSHNLIERTRGRERIYPCKKSGDNNRREGSESNKCKR